MGERGEVDSATIYTQHGQKTYFINIKENRYRDLFLVVAESIKNEAEGFNRFVLNIFEEDVAQFYEQLNEGARLLDELEGLRDFKDNLPEAWHIRSISGKKDRFFRFAVHRRARMLQLVIAERKLGESETAFSRTIRIDHESLLMVKKQYERMMHRLLEKKELRDNEPLRDPKLIERYIKRDAASGDSQEKKVIRKVVVKRRLAADNQSES